MDPDEKAARKAARDAEREAIATARREFAEKEIKPMMERMKAEHSGHPKLDERQQQIVKHVIECDRIGSEAMWEAADGMAKLAADGLTQRQIAELVGKSQSHVSFCLRLVHDYPGNRKRPPWSEEYAKVKQRGIGLIEQVGRPTIEEVNAMAADPDHVWKALGKAEDPRGRKFVDDDHTVALEDLYLIGISIDGQYVTRDGLWLMTRLVLPPRVKVEARLKTNDD